MTKAAHNGSVSVLQNCTVFTNDELEQYLLNQGGLAMSLAHNRLVILTCTYALIFATGLVGNVLNCCVIMGNRAMHTSTNFYLLNLSCSDLLTLLLGLPFELWGFYRAYPWLFGEWFCILRNAAAETTTTVSVLTITAFTVERYVAVSRPIAARASRSLRRAARVLVAIWVVSLAVGGVLAMQFGIIYLKDPADCVIEQSSLCGVREDRVIDHSFEISCMMFLLPMLIIIVFCTLIAANIRRADRFRNTQNQNVLRPRENSKQTVHSSVDRLSANSALPTAASLVPPSSANRTLSTDCVELRVNNGIAAHRKRLAINRMLFAVCATFFTCFAPFHISRVLMYCSTTHNVTGPIFNEISDNVYYISGSFYYLNATANPIIYNIMSKKFRREYMRRICNCIPVKMQRNAAHYSFTRSKTLETREVGTSTRSSC